MEEKRRLWAEEEFCWGVPPSSAISTRSHDAYYPACEDKHRGILGWMLG